jgi:hypothetical protein
MKSSQKICRRSFSSDQSQQPPCQTFGIHRRYSARRRIVLSASLIVVMKMNSLRSYGILCTATTDRAVSGNQPRGKPSVAAPSRFCSLDFDLTSTLILTKLGVVRTLRWASAGQALSIAFDFDRRAQLQAVPQSVVRKERAVSAAEGTPLSTQSCHFRSCGLKSESEVTEGTSLDTIVHYAHTSKPRSVGQPRA